MSTPFGPQLIGETEKTLTALLRRFLDGSGIDEAQWVTLKYADVSGDRLDTDGLVAAVADRAHFPNAEQIVRELNDRELLEGGRLTPIGRELVTTVQTTITDRTRPIWDNLPADEVDAATRVLNEVIARARVVMH